MDRKVSSHLQLLCRGWAFLSERDERLAAEEFKWIVNGLEYGTFS